MKKVSSNQTDAFKRKNALRYALGGEVTQPPVLGKTRAAADAAIDAEAVRGTALQQPNMVAPSITAPPPAPAPTLQQGNYEASQLLRQQPNNSVMSRLRGTNTFQFGVGGAVPVEPAFREQGGPSKRRLGADSGIPGIPPAFEEGGPITAQHPPKQGKDNQVVLAAAGEYILPKATVDAMGGPDTLDNIVRATNGKEPNNANGSALRAENGLEIPRNRALVPYNPVVGQAGGPPLGVPDSGSFRPGDAGYSRANAALNEVGGKAGNKTAALAKESLRKFAIPKGFGAKAVAFPVQQGMKIAPHLMAANAIREGYRGANTPTSEFAAESPNLSRAMQQPAAQAVLRNTPFVGPAINALFPQTPDGNQAVGDLGLRGAAIMQNAADPTNLFRNWGKKTEIKTEKPPVAAQNTPVPASNAPSETSAAKGPEYSRLRGVMDGVNMAALMTPRGFTGEFGKMLANRGTNTAALANNRQQMAEQQLEWDRQKFGLQRDWDMRRYGIDKTTDMAAKNRELGYKMIEDRFRIKDDPKSEEQVALAKAQMDAGMLDPRVGGWHAASADTISEGVRLLGADAKAANERTGLVMGPIRNTLYGDYNRARTPWDLMPQGATVPGVISNSVPVGSGGLSPDEATGRSNRWLPGASPPSQVDVDRLRQMNKGYADGGRVVKSKLRKNAC